MNERHTVIKKPKQNSGPALSTTVHLSVLPGDRDGAAGLQGHRWPRSCPDGQEVTDAVCTDRDASGMSSWEKWVRPGHLTTISFVPSPFGSGPRGH